MRGARKFLLLLLSLILIFPNGNGSAHGEVWPEAPDVASYSIEVTLDVEARQLRGRERIVYQNTGQETIPDLVFHLYLNAFRSQETIFMRESGAQHRGFDFNQPGWIDVQALRLEDGTALELELLEDGTLARAELPQPVPPGEAVTVEVEFTAQLPAVFARTGWALDAAGDPFFMVGQWFPKLGVWEDGAWNAYPFHANSEFYADFGHYDVAITLPADYRTAGVGLPSGQEDNGNGTQTVRYHAEGVIDFAWAASPNFRQDTRHAGESELVYVYLPEHEAIVEQVMEAGAAALINFSAWFGEYPYPRLTILDVPDAGAGAGGMEYPTLVTGGTVMPFSPPLEDYWLRMNELVVVHEVGHQWWQSVAAFNEAEEPWLDEGLTDYSGVRLMSQLYGQHESALDLGSLEYGNFDMRRSEYQTYPHTSMYGTAWELENYEVGAYAKPVMALTTLENILGEKTMMAGMRTFFQRFQFRHPTTEDFWAVMMEVSGQDLSWFFDGLVYGQQVVNYKVTELEPHSALIVRQGSLGIPVEIEVRFEDGSVDRVNWDGKRPNLELAFPDRPELRSVQIDPERKVVVDLQFTDNGLSRRALLSPWAAVTTRLVYQIQNLILMLGGL